MCKHGGDIVIFQERAIKEKQVSYLHDNQEICLLENADYNLVT